MLEERRQVELAIEVNRSYSLRPIKTSSIKIIQTLGTVCTASPDEPKQAWWRARFHWNKPDGKLNLNSGEL